MQEKKMSNDELYFEAETRKHQQEVARCMTMFARKLLERAARHDASKLEDPERETFIEATKKLKDLEYGSDEYKASLKEMGPVLQYHYSKNPHHPEYYEVNGFAVGVPPITCMNLVDVVEMACDWYASSQRGKDGSFRKSVAVNQERFELTPQLAGIIAQTKLYFESPEPIRFAQEVEEEDLKRAARVPRGDC